VHQPVFNQVDEVTWSSWRDRGGEGVLASNIRAIAIVDIFDQSFLHNSNPDAVASSTGQIDCYS
jgi:hypothetical protein